MSNKIVGDAACPQCVARGGDSSGNHLMIFADHGGFCNRCGYIHRPQDGEISVVERPKPSEEEIAGKMAIVQECPSQHIKARSIGAAAAQRFDVRVGLSMQDGTTPTTVYFPKHKGGQLTGYKARGLTEKRFWSVGDGRHCDFFGIEQAKRGDIWTGKLWVTEGEFDALSIYETINRHTKSEHQHIKPAVVSLPDGAGSAIATFDRNKAFIDRFDEIILCFDNDKQGQEAADAVRGLIPDKVKFVELPMKDANEMLMAGRHYELFSLVRFKAESKSPDGAVDAVDLIEESLIPPQMGLSMFLPELDEFMMGQRWHEWTAIGGGSSIGKTALAYQGASWNIKEHGHGVGMIPLEEQPAKALRNVVGRAVGSNFNDPTPGMFNTDLYKRAVQDIAPKLSIWRNSGVNSWDNISNCIRWWYITKGHRVFYIDNITVMVSHLSPSEVNTEIGRIAKGLSELVNEFPIHIYVFSHLNPPKTGPSHEDGGEVRAIQLTGSRFLQRYANNILGFERNMNAEDETAHHSTIRVLKNREHGHLGIVRTQYDPKTTLITPREVITEGEDSDCPFEE